MKKRILLLVACLPFAIAAYAQSVSQYWSFDWASTASVYSSSTVLTNTCYGGDLTVTLTTDLPHQMNNDGSGFPLSYAHPVSSVLVPYPTLVTPLNFRTTITFSTPVLHAGILLRDLDDDSYMLGPEERLLDFQVNGVPTFPSSITPTVGSYSTAGGVVTPLSEGCIGWFRFAGPVSSISFLYTRPISNYAFLLDSLVFDCRSQTRTLAATSNFEATANDGEGFAMGCDDAHLDVTSITGQRMFSMDHVNPVHGIPSEGLPTGIYVGIFTCQGETFTTKFLVSH